MAQAMNALRALALAAVAVASPVLGQTGGDPTRPPAVMTPPIAAPGAVYMAPRAPRALPQLQSILVSLRTGGRRVAVIDGKTLRQGARVGDAVLVSIGATEVVLRRGGQNQTLKLYRPATRVATAQP